MPKRIQTTHHRSTKRIQTDSNKPTRFYSTRQEKSVAEFVGGTRTKNSGATDFDKADVKAENFLIECKTKTTPSQSISVKKEWITKNEEEALFMGKPYTAIAIQFEPNGKNYYIIDEELFGILLQHTKDLT